MFTESPVRQRGATLIVMLVGSALLSLMIASTISLATSGRAGPSKDQSMLPAMQTAVLIDNLAAKIALGGGYVSTSDTDKGIQICALNEQGSYCGRFSNQHSRFCIVFPSRGGGNDSSSMDVNGVRLLGGVLYERQRVGVDLSTFDSTSFCTNHGDWKPMNDNQIFLVNSLRFCRFQGSAMLSLSHDFEVMCPSVLQADLEPNQYWVTLMDVQPRAQGIPPFLRMRLNGLWNPTKVSTP